MNKRKLYKKETQKENTKNLLKKSLFLIYKILYNIDLYFNIEKSYYNYNNKLNDKYYNYYKLF